MDKRKKVLDILKELKIDYEIVEHSAVKTMEEMNELGLNMNNKVLKNLFLYDETKKRFFLITTYGDKIINLKKLKEKISCKPLSFASEDRLKQILKLEKGEVSPFGVLNDDDNKVEVIFDEVIKSFEKVGVHPNDNTATVFLNPIDLEEIIKKSCNKFMYINLD